MANRKTHIAKWGDEIIHVNDVPIVVPKQPEDKQRFKVWNKMLKAARTICLCGLTTNKAGFAVPKFPGSAAPRDLRREWRRWYRAAWRKTNRVRFAAIIRPRHLAYRKWSRLSKRSEKVLALLARVARGETVKSIAKQLDMHPSYVGYKVEYATSKYGRALHSAIQRALRYTRRELANESLDQF